MGKPLHRKFEAPRKLVLLERGWGLNIVPPPLPRLQGGGGARGLLTFVALRIAVGEGIVVPEPAFKKLYEVVAVVAMQFRGYIFKVAEQVNRDWQSATPRKSRAVWRTQYVVPHWDSHGRHLACGATRQQHTAGARATAASSQHFLPGSLLSPACVPSAPQGRFVVAFSHTVDAVRFCHAGQTSILYAHWPAAAHEVSGGQQDMPDGRPLWKGPRVAMAVHETDEYM